MRFSRRLERLPNVMGISVAIAFALALIPSVQPKASAQEDPNECVTGGDVRVALPACKELLSKFQAAGDRHGQAITLSIIGSIYSEIGDRKQALEYYERSLPIRRELGDRKAEAVMLNNIGLAYSELGEESKAMEYYLQALVIRRQVGDRRGEAVTLNNLGLAYSRFGEEQKALDYYQQALPIRREVGDRSGEASSLAGIGRIYKDLGQKRKALSFALQALSIWTTLGDRHHEATALNNVGVLYSHLGQKKKALEVYERALVLRLEVGDRIGEATTISNIGRLYSSLGENDKALEHYEKALPIQRTLYDRVGEATTLNNIGRAYVDLGEHQKALEYYEEALQIRRALNNRPGEAVTLSSLCEFWADEHNRPLAIFYGKEAVNLYQHLRENNRDLDEDLQKSYLRRVAGTYRRLSDLLLAEGRLPEAEEVLGMLKEQEFKEFTRGAIPQSSSARSAPLTSDEQHAESFLSQGLEWQELRQVTNRTSQQNARYEELKNILSANNGNLESFWNSLRTVLPQNDVRRQTNMETSATQHLLRELPSGTAVVYTLILEDKLDLIVVQPSAMVQKSVTVKRTDLEAEVIKFRSGIRDRAQGDALLGPAQHLYQWLVNPIADELEAAHVKTIAWSLDGVLRYMPVNALYDGKHYLIERYTNVIYTPANTVGLEKKPEIATWKALGLGVSKQYENGLAPLPEVPSELRTIVRDQQDRDSHGPLPGRILLDDAFTEEAFEQQLEQNYPLVHIASHFVMGLGTDESYLLLGGKGKGGQGFRLRLSDATTWQNLTFDETELLALSACDTAISNGQSDGKEVDSLAEIGRRRGAHAVLATLWKVNDESTGRLMADFYRRWSASKSLTKAEALREAQLALLGTTSSTDNGKIEQGKHESAAGQQGTLAGSSYSHPFYWAPFILMGNWQ
jgi:CHAT domain-containing protein/Tfp pilus assembly protein PilF